MTPPGFDGTRRELGLWRVSQVGLNLIVLSVVALGLSKLLGKLGIVLLAFVIGIFTARVLEPLVGRLYKVGVNRALGALFAIVVFLAVVVGIGFLIGPSVVAQFSSLGPTLTTALQNFEKWSRELDISWLNTDRIEELVPRITEWLTSFAVSSGKSLLSGALFAVDLLSGTLLGLVTAYFFLMDGPKLAGWAFGLFPDSFSTKAHAAADAAWVALGGYLRGVLILGTIEGVVTGLALRMVGADLAVPVMILTVLGAFLPMIGAIVAGVVAILVALATAGPTAAIIIAIVVTAIQQIDANFLAPFVYGRSLELHALVILFSVVTGNALAGVPGAILSVPAVAIAISAGRGWRESALDPISKQPADDTPSGDPVDDLATS